MGIPILKVVDEVLQDRVDATDGVGVFGEEAGGLEGIRVQLVHIEVELDLFGKVLSEREDFVALFPAQLLKGATLPLDEVLEDVGCSALS